MYKTNCLSNTLPLISQCKTDLLGFIICNVMNTLVYSVTNNV